MVAGLRDRVRRLRCRCRQSSRYRINIRPSWRTNRKQAQRDERSLEQALHWLILTLIVAFLDRQIFALQIDPVKHDLGISDVQAGLLMGPAYAVFFTLMIIPAGWLIDRTTYIEGRDARCWTSLSPLRVSAAAALSMRRP